MTGHVTLEEAAELLHLPVLLVTRRIEDGRLPHVVVDGRPMCRREDVVALKARQDVQDGLMTRTYAELAELELGRPMTLLERTEANAASIRMVGRRAIEDCFRQGVPVYSMDTVLGDGIIKEYPDGRREVVEVVPDGEEVVIRVLSDAVSVFYRPDGTPFEIPRRWWHGAGMDGFVRHGPRYRGDDTVKFVVRLVDIVPARRNPGVVLDHGGFRRDGMVRVLQGIAGDLSMPPVEVRRTESGTGHLWELAHGYHRYCASLAAGFEEIVAVEVGRL